jgi:hypothetical protein
VNIDNHLFLIIINQIHVTGFTLQIWGGMLPSGILLEAAIHSLVKHYFAPGLTKAGD